jgi:hypothetical protein
MYQGRERERDREGGERRPWERERREAERMKREIGERER